MAAGYRSYTASWEGGASRGSVQGGYVSLLAFWQGGASGAAVVAQSGGGKKSRTIIRPRRKLEQEVDEIREQLIKEDAEIILIMTAILKCY